MIPLVIFFSVQFEFFCPEAFGLFPDEYDCEIYYECKEGKPKRMTCPDGLLYGQIHEECFYPFDVNCGTRAIRRKC